MADTPTIVYGVHVTPKYEPLHQPLYLSFDKAKAEREAKEYREREGDYSDVRVIEYEVH